jgi:cytochrome c-type biogenesis protein CcmF
VVLVALGVRLPVALVGFGLVIFSGFTTLAEFMRGARVRSRATGQNYLQALVGLVTRNRRRYGGYLVHVAVVLMALGIVGSSVYKAENTAALRRGESMLVGPYTLTYQGVTQFTQGDKQVTMAQLTVTENGRPIGVMRPIREFHPRWQQPMTIPFVRTTAKEDLYVILNTWEAGGELATFKVTINPLTVWIWIGGVLFVAATLLALWPEAQRRPVPARAPVGGVLAQ